MKILVSISITIPSIIPPKNVHDYIKDNSTYDSWVNGLKSLGHDVYLQFGESFFVPETLKLSKPILYSVLMGFIRKSGLIYLDTLLRSIKIGFFCKKNNIDAYVNFLVIVLPKVVKKIAPNLVMTMWYGIFPDMSSKKFFNLLTDYDLIWTAAEYDFKTTTSFKDMDKLHYIGSSANDRFCYYDYDEKYSFDVVFVGGVGSAHNERIEVLELIARKFENFAFYGYGVENIPKGYKLLEKYKGMANQHQIRKLFSSSKIALNLTLDRYDRATRGFNIRLFEISMCGGALQIVKYDKKIIEFYEPGLEVVTYENNSELLEKVKYYIGNEVERKSFAEKAFVKSKSHGFDKKAKIVIDCINAEVSKREP